MSVGAMDDGDESAERKLGDQIARAIAREISTGDLTIGARIGTEDELVQRYAVSRWIIREAVAVLEMDGLVESHRGARGGLYVSTPAASLRIATLRHYFSLAGATAADINRTRAVVEGQVITRLMHRMTVDEAEGLRRFRERPEGSAPEALARNTNALLRELLRLAAHPALELFSVALAQANIDRALWYGASETIIQRLSEQTWDVRLRQIEAMIARDEVAALACQSEIAAAGVELHVDCSNPPRDLATAMVRAAALGQGVYVSGSARVVKKPEAVARLIAQRLIQRLPEAGDRIGSEAEMLVELDVSRNVLREAIRLLERYGIVAVKRGPNGGLRAIRRNPLAIVRATSLYLAPFYALSQGSFHRLSGELQLEAATQAAERARAGDLQFTEELGIYRASLTSPQQESLREEVFRFYSFLASVCGNPVLDCVMRSLIVPVEFAETHLPEARLAELRSLQLRLADALGNGDAALARRLALALRKIGAQARPRQRPTVEMVTLR